MLRLQLLGTFQLSYQGEAIPSFDSSPRLQSLVALLALHPHTLYHRNDLATLFWPASEPSQARTNLRKLIFKLRKALPQPDRYLIQNGKELGWQSHAPYTVDVDKLQQRLGEIASAPPDPRLLQDAINLYRGELLPAVYDDWVIPLRHDLEARVIQALQQLATQLQQQAAYAGAISAVQQLLALEPYSEAHYRWLMQLWAQNGERVRAIQAYQACVTMLRVELHATPDSETEALYQQLLANSLIARLPASGAAAGQRQPQPVEEEDLDPEASTPPFLASPDAPPALPREAFIARERELATLNRRLDRAMGGESQLLFVSGDAGQGKTTLVNEFARRAQEMHADLLVALGSCDAYAGLGDPYLPFRDLFAVLCADVEAQWHAGQVTRVQADRLWAFLPKTIATLLDRGAGLFDVLVNAESLAAHAVERKIESAQVERLRALAAEKRHGGPDFQQQQLFEQCLNVLRQLTGSRPIVLILDDVQWADAASLSLLFHLGRRLTSERLLLITTYRPVAVRQGRAGQRHPLAPIINEFQRLRGDILLELDKTPEAEGRAFVNHLLDQTPNRLGPAFRRALFDLTAGHPLFAVEVLRDLKARRDLVRDDAGHWVARAALDWQRIPARVEGVIAERINRLEDALRQTLEVASIQGESFTAEVVADVLGLHRPVLIGQLSRELERNQQLIQESGRNQLSTGRLSHFTFRHTLFRQFLYQRLGDSERAYLHESVGLALESIYHAHREQIAAQCALHFSKAGNREKTIEYTLLAGERACRQYAHQEALAHLSRALEHLPARDIERRYDCLLTREKIYRRLGDRERQRQDLIQLQTLAETMAGPQQRAEVALRWTLFADAVGDLPTAIKRAQETVGLAQQAGNAKLEAAGLYQWGKALWRKDEDFATARDQIEQALLLTRQEQTSFTGATSLLNLGMVQQAARVQLEKALSVAQRAAAEQVEADSLHTLGVVTLILGDLDAAKASYEQALIKQQALGNISGEAHCLNSLGTIALVVDGDPQKAMAYFCDALDLYIAMGHRRNEGLLRGNLGDVAAFSGDHDQAWAYRNEALAIFRDIDARRDAGYCLKEMGVIDRRQRRYTRAGSQLQEAIHLFRESPDPRGERMTLIELGIWWRTLGQYDKARTALQDALTLYKEAGQREGQCRVMVELSLLHTLRGEPAAAHNLCEAAATWLQQAGSNPGLLAAAQTGLAYALTGAGAFTQAQTSFASAARVHQDAQQEGLPIEQIAGQAQALLARGETEPALDVLEEIINPVMEDGVQNAHLPGQVFLTCYQVLLRNRDARATQVLQKANQWLAAGLATIEVEELRRTYRTAVPAHQRLTAASDAENR